MLHELSNKIMLAKPTNTKKGRPRIPEAANYSDSTAVCYLSQGFSPTFTVRPFFSKDAFSHGQMASQSA